MNANQLLSKLDRIRVDSSVEPDCRRVLGLEADTIRVCLARVERWERLETAAKRRSSSSLEECRDNARAARESLGKALTEARRVMSMWGVAS